MSVIPSVAVDLCGRLRPSFHPAACSACSPSMSWERKLLHCGPRADRRDLLAHYLFISVLHRWLPRGSDRGVSPHRPLVGTGVLDTAARWTDACYWKDNLAAYRSPLLSGDSMRPVNIFFFHVRFLFMDMFVLNNVTSKGSSDVIAIIFVHFSLHGCPS